MRLRGCLYEEGASSGQRTNWNWRSRSMYANRGGIPRQGVAKRVVGPAGRAKRTHPKQSMMSAGHSRENFKISVAN